MNSSNSTESLLDSANVGRHLHRITKSLLTAPTGLWVTLRLTTIAVASLALIYQEDSNALQSLSKLFLGPWYSYDAVHYVHIVKIGYRAGDITSGFHPLYPWLATVTTLFVRDPLLGLLVTSSVAGLLFVVAFYHLARLDVQEDRAWTATAMCILWPSSVAIFAPYTEALFLLLATLSLLAVRRKSYLLAGIAGALAALTRQHGILLAIPIAWELWEDSNRNFAVALKNWVRWTTILLVPTGYGFWILYRAFAIDDVRPDFSGPQNFIYSVMVSKAHYSVFKEQQFLLPFDAIWRATKILLTQNVHWSNYGDVLLAVLFLAAFGFAWRYLRASYRLYCLSVVLIGLSFHTGSTVGPYVGLPRHMLPAFPVFIGVAARHKFRNPLFVFVVAAICEMLVLCCYVWETWVL